MESEKIYNEYLKGMSYKNSINLHEVVQTNENFFVGKQWEGLKVTSLDPLIFNILKRVANLFISMIVSDDISCQTTPFYETKVEREKCLIIDAEVERAMENTKAKTKNRHMLKNCIVDGDGCFYLYFNPDTENGQKVKGEIEIDIIDNVDIFFGNSASADVQSQPYIIISMRNDVSEVKREAEQNGIGKSQIEEIIPDSKEAGLSNIDEDNKVTVLLKMEKKGGKIAFSKCTKGAMVMEEKLMDYALYPVAFMNWDKVKNSYHGVSPITYAIPNQIAINKLYSMYVQCIKQIAFPKIIYDATRFPNGYNNDIGKAIAMRGNPNEAILSAFRAPDISSSVMVLIERMIKDTMELMGATDASLGTVPPNNTSAIVAVQKSSIAPLELVKLSFFQFVEDYVNILVDMMGVHYGTRDVVVTRDNSEKEVKVFDFGEIKKHPLRINVDIGTTPYFSETMQTITNDNLLASGIITDPIVYVENIPTSQIKGKAKIIKALKEKAIREASMIKDNKETTAQPQADKIERSF